MLLNAVVDVPIQLLVSTLLPTSIEYTQSFHHITLSTYAEFSSCLKQLNEFSDTTLGAILCEVCCNIFVY